MKTEKVEIVIKDGIGEITFFNPKGNSLNSNILSELTIAFNSLSKNDDAKVIVLKSFGASAFCGGAAINEMMKINELSIAEKYFLNFSKLLKSMILNNKIIVCKVQGKVVGGGIGLVSACDFVVADSSASVKLSEFAIGIGPFAISPVVEKRLGNTAFKALTLDYDWHNAEWALGKGLYDKVVERTSELEMVVAEQALKISVGNIETAAELKKIFWSDSQKIIEQMNERAKLSARLLISEQTQQRLAKIFSR